MLRTNHRSDSFICKYVLQTGLYMQGEEDDSFGQIRHTDYEA